MAEVWIDAEHDGYRRPFGILHRRRIYLAGTGDDLRVEDVLNGRGGHRFAVRLHLHPNIQVSLLHNRTTALLRLPGGGAWKLRANGAEVALADSVYLGEPDQKRRTQQVVLNGITQAGATVVKWALQRDATASGFPASWAWTRTAPCPTAPWRSSTWRWTSWTGACAQPAPGPIRW